MLPNNMKTIVVLLLLVAGHAQGDQQHRIRKRFLWKSLAQLAQPFIKRPKPQQPQYYPTGGGLPAPPVFQVSPTAAQPIRIPPSSGQLYLPLPNQVYNPPTYQPPQGGSNYAPAPVYVPPSSYGNQGYGNQYNNYQQPPSYSPASMPPYNMDSQWKPMNGGNQGSLYYGQVTGGVGAPSLPLAADQHFPGIPGFDMGIPSLSGVDVAVLVTDPFRGAASPTVFLSGSDRSSPAGFTKVELPISVLRSVLNTGLESPTIYVATTSFAPSNDFVPLSLSNSTIDVLRIASLQPNSSKAADIPMSAAEDLVVAIRTAAPKLVGNTTSLDLGDIGINFDVLGGLDVGDSLTTTTSSTSLEQDDATPETTTEADIDSELGADQPALSAEESTELPVVYLARRDAVVPADYIRVLLPDDILKELRRRVRLRKLHEHAVSRSELTEAYLAPSVSTKVAPPIGMVDVELSREALQVLSDYANEAEKIQNSKPEKPQLELPRSVLEHLSKDSSQRVRLKSGNRQTAVKTGSNDVFIAPSDQKPPEGYVSIPLSDNAMNELKKNFLGSNVRNQDLDKGIPVRAYIAPADQKLPAGHVAVPLPDTLLESVRGSPGAGSSIMFDEDDSVSTSDRTSGRTIDKGKSGGKSSSSAGNHLMRGSDIAVFMSPSRKRAPSKFRKLTLPESIMEDLRQAVPMEKLAESGLPAKDLTAAYLASANEFVPPGFISVTVPDTLVKILETFADNHDLEDEPRSNRTSSSSRPKSKGSSRNSILQGEGDGVSLPRQIIDAVIDASRRTLKDVLKSTRDQDRKTRTRSRTTQGRNRGRGSSGSGGRDNARTTNADAEENEFEDKDDAEREGGNDDYIDMYQPQYQVSPFFPSSMATYPYVDPYQYGGLWQYGDGQVGWAGDGSSTGMQNWPAYQDYSAADYGMNPSGDGFQNRDSYAYYYGDGQDPSQYEVVDSSMAQAQTAPQRSSETAQS